MSTPHNNAEKGQIAKTVLMPGDPLRAKFIAEHFLKDAECFNTVRGMLGFTGTYEGKRVSVMGSGMGMPSIGIYSWELFSFYDVENIIRIGSAGAYTEDLNLFDVCVAKKAYSESSYAKVQQGYTSDTMLPSEKLNKVIVESANELGIKIHECIVHSSDVFYSALKGKEYDDYQKKIEDLHLDITEMESFALFANAKALSKNAACILTVSDNLKKHTLTTAEERQNSFTNMMKVALNAAIKL